ncbi:divergent PAP2 family protein [Papillibacter cinnamivorans]|uniref:Divergent PAP2 family protein n=1 Tax=Papillibacter cinnamivorans DSM 12816 TaxID=1122930 RepID=A0A1W2CKD5_9FIRM|nr:divergent PAP2 family protein [Papillibacter cinnamivorans]SMC85486.1 hypothetical protein SAMN02745168_0027 [Papillibacter cinnamivorans DSM 12816]
MNYVAYFTCNKILNLAILAWVVAQILKVPIYRYTDKRWDIKMVFGSGGMPSSHSAFVVACATSVGKLYGISSPLFAISAVVAVVVMYDASNVRRAAGEQAKVLNYMMEHWSEMKPEILEKELKVMLGHTPFQVAAGAVLGLLIGLLA